MRPIWTRTWLKTLLISSGDGLPGIVIDSTPWIVELVEAWLEEALRVSGFHRVHDLEIALTLARDRGLPDLVEQAANLLQETRVEDLELQRIEHEVTIPADVIDNEVQRIVGDSNDLFGALDRFARSGPPTGDLGSNEELVDQLAVEAPIQAMIPTSKLGGDGLPRFTPQSDEEQRDSKIAEIEVFRLRFFGTIAVLALDRMLPGDLETDPLAAFWAEREHVSEPIASSLANGFRLFAEHEHEAAAYLVAPRIETLARKLVLQTGRGIYRAQRQSHPAQYPGLGFLIGELRAARLPESWCRYLSTFLAHPAGLNFPQRLLHGFVASVRREEAATVLHAAAFLARLELVATPRS